MPNNGLNARIFCPFFVREDKKTITCEGVIGKSTTSLFKDEMHKKIHEEAFCTNKNCEHCDIHISNMRKYR